MDNVNRTVRVAARRDVIADLAPPPPWVEPQLCKLVTKIPAGDGWAHEIKFDGFRMHARIVKGAAALLTRNGLDWTQKYPATATAIGALKCRQAYLDGELCPVLPDGTTSFSALQGQGDSRRRYPHRAAQSQSGRPASASVRAGSMSPTDGKPDPERLFPHSPCGAIPPAHPPSRRRFG
jgi:ATP-dependent DNA ligase